MKNDTNELYSNIKSLKFVWPLTIAHSVWFGTVLLCMNVSLFNWFYWRVQFKFYFEITHQATNFSSSLCSPSHSFLLLTPFSFSLLSLDMAVWSSVSCPWALQCSNSIVLRIGFGAHTKRARITNNPFSNCVNSFIFFFCFWFYLLI